MQYFVEVGAIAVRRCKKADLKRIAKATGATFLTSLSNMEGMYEIFAWNIGLTNSDMFGFFIISYYDLLKLTGISLFVLNSNIV